MLTALLAATLWAIPPAAPTLDQVLMRAWYAQNDVCRGSSEPSGEMMCRWRDDTGRLLAARGWEWSSRYGWQFRVRLAR